MQVIAYNKILMDFKPIEDICSPDDAHWIKAKIANEGVYETDTHVFRESNASLSIPGGEPGYAPGSCSVSLAEHQEKIGKLYDADPDCWHELDKNCMSGIRCTKCGGWYCL